MGVTGPPRLHYYLNEIQIDDWFYNKNTRIFTLGNLCCDTKTQMVLDMIRWRECWRYKHICISFLNTVLMIVVLKNDKMYHELVDVIILNNIKTYLIQKNIKQLIQH